MAEDLSKYGKNELIQLILDLQQENQKLKGKVDELQEFDSSKFNGISSQGTLMSAGERLLEILQKGDQEAKDLQEHIALLKLEQMQIKAKEATMLDEMQAKCDELIQQTKERLAKQEEETRIQCEENIRSSKESIDQYKQTVLDNCSRIQNDLGALFKSDYFSKK